MTFKMDGPSQDKEMLKARIRKWMRTSGVYSQKDTLDTAVVETFFYIYNKLEEGEDIHEIGNHLGIFPIP